MKLKSTKLLLCGILTTLLLIRNLQDSQFVMSFFFIIVSWQCCRAAFDVKDFEDGKEKQAAQDAATKRVYGPLAGAAWTLPYVVLAVCVVVGIAIPALQMPMVWLFLAAVVAHSVCQVVIWKMMVREKKNQE